MNAVRGYSPFSNFCQNAYVTTDFDQALAHFRERYGIPRFFELRDGEMETAPGRYAGVHVGFAWVGRLQIELIQPLGGFDAIYREGLPEDGAFAMRFHHTCQLVESEAEYETLLLDIEQRGLAIAAQGQHGGHVRYLYIDARAELGHYLEHTYYTPAGLALFEQVPRY